MRISDIFSQVNRLINKDSKQVKTTAAHIERSKTCDSLEISPEAKEVKDLVAITLRTPARDAEEIAAIKEQIAQGTYQMDSKKLAEKMLAKE